MFDEYGIDFQNQGVLEISAPIITVSAPHPSEIKRNEPYTFVWTQYMLIDAKQLKKIDAPIFMGKNTEPTTGGDWGHYEIAGERLRCRERERLSWGSDMDVCFCFEPLRDIQQGSHRGKNVKSWWTEWRPVCIESVIHHRPQLLDWVRKYKGELRVQAPQFRTLYDTWPEERPGWLDIDELSLIHI